MSTEEIQPKRCALRFKPPTLILLYVDCSSGKQRRRSMPLRGISTSTNVEEFARTYVQNHPRHAKFFREIPQDQLHLLLQRVKDGCAENETPKQSEKSEDNTKTNEPPMLQNPTTTTGVEVRVAPPPRQPTSDPPATLPPVSSPSQTGAWLLDLPPLASKQVVGNRGELPQFSVDDLLGPLVEKQDNPHRSKESALSPEHAEGNYSYDFSSPDHHEDTLSLKEISTIDGGGSVPGSEVEQQPHSLTLPDIVTVDNFSEASANDEQDLNKVSEQMLAQEKKKMDGLFETNQVLPGERDWKYDKQRDFEPPQMESGWDSESSSTQKF